MITRISKLGLALVTLVVLGLIAAPNARADTFTFNGTLSSGSPVQLFSLTVSNSSSVLIRGTANFDLALSLFDAAGDTLNIAIDEDGLGPPFVATLEDEFGNLFLMPGTYLLAVTPLPLLPGSNLSEGFFFATDQFGNELMSFSTLNSHRIVHHSDRQAKSTADGAAQPRRHNSLGCTRLRTEPNGAEP